MAPFGQKKIGQDKTIEKIGKHSLALPFVKALVGRHEMVAPFMKS